MSGDLLRLILALTLAPLSLFIMPILFWLWNKDLDKYRNKCREWVEAKGGTVISINEIGLGIRLTKFRAKWKDGQGRIRLTEYTPGLGDFRARNISRIEDRREHDGLQAIT